MSTHKNIDRICAVTIIAALIVTVLFMNGEALGIRAADRVMGYEDRLFDTSRVHTVDIVMDDWEGFIETCESEEYSACSVVIDGEAFKNVAIRGKGNTSLSTVRTMGSQRYSFKLEFDQYESGKSYHGLDKLSLNNIIQDNTYMKDYLAYRLMAEFGADAPLCSYVYITVNGEDWGLYLAVEGVEDSFLERVYGRDTGELYKPDRMSFGGGRGNGKDFDMDDFLNRDGESEDGESSDASGSFDPSQFGGGDLPGGFGFGQSGEEGGFSFGGMTPPGGFGTGESGEESFSGFGDMTPPEGFDPSQFSAGELPEDFDPSQFFGGERPEGGEGGGGFSFDFGGAFGGMGSTDVKLKYIDDDPDSYANIFDNAKTDVTKADQKRLIRSLKKLSENEDIESVVDVDEVIRYFVVHNFVCNGDSYTGSIIHNYYLHESEGVLSMIPWDYNLAFGTFQSSDATGMVNDPVDSPMSVSDASDRPMWGWIISSEEYTALYHEYFAEFLDTMDIAGIIDEAYNLIKSYVEKDPTAFCTYEEFEKGVSTLRTFCELRSESIRGQLEGTIPSTSAGQRTDSSALVDASSITLSDMGSMGGGRGGGMGGGFGGFSGRGDSSGESSGSAPGGDMPGSGSFPGGSMPNGSGAFPGAGEGDGDSAQQPGGLPGQGGGQGFPGGGFPGGNMPGGGTGFTGGSIPGNSGDGSGFPSMGGSPFGGQSDGSGEASGQSGSRPQPGGSFGDFPGMGSSRISGGNWALVGISAAVLLAGLLIAFLYRRR